MRRILLSLLLCLTAIPAMAQAQDRGPQTYKVSRNTYAKAVTIDKQPSRWRFSLDLALSYRTGKPVNTGDAVLNDFIEEMRDGTSYGADVHYFVSRGWAVGLRLNGFSYSNSIQSLTFAVNNFYTAPSFIWRHFTANGNGAWVLGASIGYISYNERLSYLGSHASTHKGSLATTIDVGYDIRLGTSNTFLGLRLTLFDGAVRLPSGVEDLRSANMSVGLRF